MRQPAVDLSRLHDRIVIAVIGDSHSYGSGAFNPAYTFPARLEHHLNAQVGRDAFTVLNLGVIGYNMVQELEVLRAKALGFHPDLDHPSVPHQRRPHPELHSPSLPLAQPCHSPERAAHQYPGPRFCTRTSDTTMCCRTSTVQRTFSSSLLAWSAHRSHASWGATVRLTRHEAPILVPARYLEFIGRDNLERAVGAFGEVCRQHRIPTLATGFIEDGDRGVYERAGFQIYPFFRMFEGLDIRRYGYHPDRTDSHFSDVGNDVIGQRLAEYVRGHFSFGTR